MNKGNEDVPHPVDPNKTINSVFSKSNTSDISNRVCSLVCTMVLKLCFILLISVTSFLEDRDTFNYNLYQCHQNDLNRILVLAIDNYRKLFIGNGLYNERHRTFSVYSVS